LSAQLAESDRQGRKFDLEWSLVKILTWLVSGLACLLLATQLRAFDIQPQSLPDGLTAKVGDNQLEIRVASPHTFRFHIYAPDFPTPAPSIFLSGAKQPDTPFTITHDDIYIGLKTAFGELRVDAMHQTFTLLDPTGATLIGWSQWGIGDFKKADDHLGFSQIGLREVPGAKTSPRYYGSGSAPKVGELLQSESPGFTGNGFSSLPQYWSSAGYGALMVGADDKRPSNWQSQPNGRADWGVHGAEIDLYLAPAPTIKEWIRDQAELTGFAPVPPRWAFGYLQSRWGWKDKAYIDDTLARFRKDQLPVDAFIFDFEWYTKIPDYQVPAEGKPDFADFSWNDTLFPDPAAQVAGFAQNGLKMIGIRKPRLGNSDNVALAKSKGWIVPTTSPDPSNRRNIDFSRPDVRAWYEDHLQKFDETGVVAFWNDEGELQYNEYMYWNIAESELMKRVKPDARFWSINRAFSPGMQRLGAATWSGDISSDWNTLNKVPPQLLAYSLAGMPYSTCDIGGFAGEDTPELLTRWMQAGVFFGVMRSHSLIDRTPRFPWLYGPDAENAIRKALDLRYRLIPYYYSLAHGNSHTALPLMRALVMEFPEDEKVFTKSDEWLMGDGLLVAPVMHPGTATTPAPPGNKDPKAIPPAPSADRDVYLPKDTWFKFGTNEMTVGPQTIRVTAKLDEIPMYVRAGTLLPLGPVLQDTAQTSTDPLELQIYSGKDATFDFVEDDGATLAYQKGNVRITHFTWDNGTRRLSWKIEGPYHGANCFHALNIILFTPGGKGTKHASLDAADSVTFPAGAGLN
jgi:alpha-glucosidase